MRIGFLFPSIYASQVLFSDKIFAPRELAIDMVNGLVDAGHEVTVYSVPDLPIKAKLVSEPLDSIKNPLPYYKFRGVDESHRHIVESEFAKHHYELNLTMKAFQDAHKEVFDVMHVYHDSAMFFSHYLDELMHDIPVVYTLHDPLPPPNTYEFGEFAKFLHHNYVSISNSFRKSDLALNFVATAYHGINLEDYPFNPSPEDHYLFLGRLVPEKGLHNAIAAVSQTGDKLVVSVNLPVKGEENDYYQKTIGSLPSLWSSRDLGASVKANADGAANHATPRDGQLTILPVVDKKTRIELYGQAKALLFPIEWEEPFGIVLIEAMACGTPVIAYNRGSVPEIVKDGVTGFIIDPDDAPRSGKGTWIIKKQGIEGIIDAMGHISELKREDCRAHVKDVFSVGNMIHSYEAIYQGLQKK